MYFQAGCSSELKKVENREKNPWGKPVKSKIIKLIFQIQHAIILDYTAFCFRYQKFVYFLKQLQSYIAVDPLKNIVHSA